MSRNLLLSSNDSFSNSTILNNGTMTTTNGSLYPSSYTIPQIIVASVFVIVVMIIVIIGNMLVIIAISTEKSLKNIQNWFIASLAVADFSLGLIVMPFSLANELMGYWIFGNWWCDFHSALDVLLCTSSIMNLCLISLDRYWSITQAVDYLKKRTPSRAIFMIAAVWVLSALICIPPLLGWKVDRTSYPNEKFPKCQLSEELGYVLYSALGSFYVPCCIMVFVYIRIYYAAKARARRGIRKVNRKQQKKNNLLDHNNITQEPATNNNNNHNSDNKNNHQISTIASSKCQIHVQIPTVVCDFASDASSCSDIIIEEDQEPSSPKHTLQVTKNNNLDVYTTAVLCTDKEPKKKSYHSSMIEIDGISEFEPSSSDSGIISRCAIIKPFKSKIRNPILRFRSDKNGKQKSINANQKATTTQTSKNKVSADPDGQCSTSLMQSGTQSLPHAQSEMELQKQQQQQQTAKSKNARDPEREKRRIARKKEKRATLILGLIMGAFIACWLPFFLMYIFRLVVDLPSFAFSAAFWLGYLNSALNPVIYTIFNKDFRKAFRRILFK